MRRTIAPYLMLTPLLALLATFFAYPLASSLIQSLTTPRRTLGFENFIFLFRDRLFWLALANTAGYTLAAIVVQGPLSLGLALLLDRKNLRGRSLWRLAFFSPHLVGVAYVALVFNLLLDRGGPLSTMLRTMFPSLELNWLADPILARVGVVIAAAWLGVGYGMVYLLAALQSIDRQLYDAAAVDGATGWRKLWHVTLPGLRPTLAFLLVLQLVAGFQLFELPYLLLQGVGPGQAGLTIVGYLFAYGIELGDLGYAAAIGWALAALLLVTILAAAPIVRKAADR